MNWKTIHNKIGLQKRITDDIDDNYTLITRDNLSDLKLGVHIKYIKNVFNPKTNEIEEKIYNGGFLINILNKDKPYETILVLKSNIIWKLRFIKYKVYKLNAIKNELRKQFDNILDEKMVKFQKTYDNEINEIIKNKNKHKVIFK